MILPDPLERARGWLARTVFRYDRYTPPTRLFMLLGVPEGATVLIQEDQGQPALVPPVKNVGPDGRAVAQIPASMIGRTILVKVIPDRGKEPAQPVQTVLDVTETGVVEALQLLPEPHASAELRAELWNRFRAAKREASAVRSTMTPVRDVSIPAAALLAIIAILSLLTSHFFISLVLAATLALWLASSFWRTEDEYRLDLSEP